MISELPLSEWGFARMQCGQPGNFTKALQWFPIALILAVIVYCYHAYIITFCIMILIYGEPSYKTRGALFIVVGHVFLFLLLASFYQALFSRSLYSTDCPDLFLAEPSPEEFESPKPSYREGKTYLPSSYASYCYACQYVKPDRAHHCRHCNKCILRFDHYCLWLVRCVGLGNYKAFLLTMFYGILGAWFIDITMLQQMIYDAANGSLVWNELQMLIATALTLGFSLALAGLLIFHAFLISKNQTTIERMDASRKDEKEVNPYDLGSVWKNWKAVLGPRPWLWLIPVNDFELGNAIWFERKQQPGMQIV